MAQSFAKQGVTSGIESLWRTLAIKEHIADSDFWYWSWADKDEALEQIVGAYHETVLKSFGVEDETGGRFYRVIIYVTSKYEVYVFASWESLTDSGHQRCQVETLEDLAAKLTKASLYVQEH